MNIPPRSEPALAVALHHYNDTPLPDFCGLSPAQMHPLLYQPLGPASVVRLRPAVPDGVLCLVRLFVDRNKARALLGFSGGAFSLLMDLIGS